MLALRSDGTVVAFGNNSTGQCNVPPLPPGMHYEQVDCFHLHSLFLRSDGTLLHAGSPGSLNWAALAFPAQPPPGLEFNDVAAGLNYHAALLSDGSAMRWPLTSVQPPPLPWGVYYVDVESGESALWLRRSDGQVGVVGFPVWPVFTQFTVPEFDPGTSVLDLGGDYRTVAARLGPTCTYVGVHPGCAGSRQATRLVPRDTPRIGQTFALTLFDLPVDIALLATGWQQTAPLDLGSLGMPGCELAVSTDVLTAIVGQSTRAKWSLPIPDLPALVGLRFYNQALVLDPFAGNSFGAVLSDAMEGVIGFP